MIGKKTPGTTPGTQHFIEWRPLFDRLGISAEISCHLVKDFGKLFSVVAGRPQEIDEYRSRDTSRRDRARAETRESLATA